MDPTLGIISPQNRPHYSAFALPKNVNIIGFAEIESCFAYLLNQNLEEIFIDEVLLKPIDSGIKKYLKQLEQLHPNLKINTILLKENTEEIKLIKYYPKLEVLLEKGEITTLFQPLVEHHDKILGVECLSRFYYHGQIYAPDFVFNYAQEKLKLVNSDKMCIMQALNLIPYKDILIFLNVRPQTLISNDFYFWFKALLKKHQLLPEQMVIEITEQYCNISEGDLASQCRVLENAGFRLAIDDFGAGISNLSMLEIMKPSFLKISGRFINNVMHNPYNQKIIKNVLLLAHDLAITTIVESVESKEDHDVVKSLGGNICQGFYFYKPMTALQFKQLMMGY